MQARPDPPHLISWRHMALAMFFANYNLCRAGPYSEHYSVTTPRQYSRARLCPRKAQTTFSEGSAHLALEAISICIYLKGTFPNVHNVSCISSMSKNAGYVPQVHGGLVIGHLFM